MNDSRDGYCALRHGLRHKGIFRIDKLKRLLYNKRPLGQFEVRNDVGLLI